MSSSQGAASDSRHLVRKSYAGRYAEWNKKLAEAESKIRKLEDANKAQKLELLKQKQNALRDNAAKNRKLQELKELAAARRQPGPAKEEQGDALDLETLKHCLEELQCPICTEIFVSPSLTTCGHIFCQKCIQNWSNRSPNCPICRGFVGAGIKVTKLNGFIEKTIGHFFPEEAAGRLMPAPEAQGARALPAHTGIPLVRRLETAAVTVRPPPQARFRHLFLNLG